MLGALCSLSASSQIKYNLKTEKVKGKEIVCPARFVDEPSFVDMPEYVKERLKNKKARPSETKGATFNVTYVGFPADAKTAFQRAVDIWAAILDSPVPIKVTAYWQELETNVLGSATANDFFEKFPWCQRSKHLLPIGLG